MPMLFFRLIVLVVAGLTLHSSMPATAAGGLVAGGAAVRVTVEPATVAPGESAQLHVRLDRPGGVSTILTLKITYANGDTQQVLGSTLGSAATLAWETPADAGAGPAKFRLTAGDCGCGERSTRVQNILPPGVVEGSFVVRAD